MVPHLRVEEELQEFLAAEDEERQLAVVTGVPDEKKGERLVVRGKVVKPGRTLTVSTAEAFCLQGGVERLCAVMLQSLIRVPLAP